MRKTFLCTSIFSYMTNFFSPHDMALIEHIPELMETGVDSFKIEGRARAPDYVATATRVYREAINEYDSGNYKYNPKWMEFKIISNWCFF